MQKHEEFEQLCALAIIGELTPEEHAMLDLHLQKCGQCRAASRGMRDLAYGALPLADRTWRHVGNMLGYAANREEFLERAGAQGVVFSARARRKSLLRAHWPVFLLQPYYSAAATAACLLLAAVLGFRMYPAMRPAFVQQPTQVAVAQRAPQSGTGQEAVLVARLAQLSRQVASLETELRQASGAAAAKGAEAVLAAKARDAMLGQLVSLRGSLNALEKQSQDLREALSLSQASNSALQQKMLADVRAADDLRAQLVTLSTTREKERGTMVAQAGRLEELSEQVRLLHASVDRDRELLAAGRDIRDLMGARNLHIIDVHDVDNSGKKRKTFGRVFYTEGRSLIFYAYDLPAARGLKNVAFQAWAQKDWNRESPVSLGIFYVDDQKLSRWVLKVEDPVVLRQIDSVFVTVERPGGVKHPTGDKLLFASFINQANHP